MASPKDEWNTVTQFAVQNWSDASQYRYRERQYLLKNLIAKGETTCFLADPGVEILQFRRASSYLSPRSCGQWRHIFAARGRSDDRVAFRVERDGRDVRPVARMA